MILVVILLIFFSGCYPDFYIIETYGLAKNPERVQNNIPVLLSEFDDADVTRGSITCSNCLWLLFFDTKSNKPAKYQLGKEIFFDSLGNDIENERDTYEYKDTILGIDSYYGKNRSKSSASAVPCNGCELIPNITHDSAMKIVARWQRGL